MSEAKFNKAVAIVQSLPKDGPIRPTQDDQLYVRTPVFFLVLRALYLGANMFTRPPPPGTVLLSLQTRYVCEARSQWICGLIFPGSGL